jgi:hypothetical protein
LLNGYGAIEASIKRGAVPIVLVDGEAIVELMIEKGFGVQTENLPILSYALDIALSNEESPLGEDPEVTRSSSRVLHKS